MFEKYVEEFNGYLTEEVTSYEKISDDLIEAMNYSLKAGGKRFRPVLMILFANAIGLDYKKTFDSAVAIEMIHTFSLIHDDLPCMDDDDLRRGVPTNHKVFGEDIALLAGDGLNNLAYQSIFKSLKNTSCNIDLLDEFSKSIMKMIEGQVLDMDDRITDLEGLKKTHQNKTGALIEFSCIAPFIIKGEESEKISKIKQFAYYFGLSFQIKDDILDVCGSIEALGKSQSDLSNNKLTYVSLLGLEKAQNYLVECIDRCKEILKEMNIDTDELIELCDYSINREK